MARPQVEATEARGRLMRTLLRHKADGLTLDELRTALGTSRNAVRQHVGQLEREGLVEVVGRRTATGGRPSRAYGLSEAGLEAFPRRYDQLALGMLESVRDGLGEAALESLLARMADDLAREARGGLETLPPERRRAAVVERMNELGYDARLDPDGAIVAVNCVFHRLAARTRAVCRFDERLLTALLGEDVRLRGCMQDGRDGCTFGAAVRDADAGAEAGAADAASPGAASQTHDAIAADGSIDDPDP